MQEAVPEDSVKDELMESLSKGNFTMRILYEQLANIQKMGPVGQVMGMIPGLSNSGLFTKVRVQPLLLPLSRRSGSAADCKTHAKVWNFLCCRSRLCDMPHKSKRQ
jgi:hypothetical protein